MESANRQLPLGSQLQECLIAAREAWLKNRKAGLDAESAWTLDVIETHLMMQLRAGGRAEVQVVIIARHPWDSETQVFKLARQAPDGWIRCGESIN